MLHLHLGRGGAAVPRVRALYHGFAQRLRRAAPARLRGAAGEQPQPRRLRRRSARDVLQWRRRHTGNRREDPCADAALGTGCRRSWGRLERWAVGTRSPDHLRCRRHLGRYRHRRRRAFCRGYRPRHVDRRLPGAGADDRYPHDRRRRRLDRLCRQRWRLSRRPSQRRRRSRAGGLWPRRRRADGDRRQSRSRPARPREFSGWCDAARPGGRAERRRWSGGTARPWPRGTRPRAS